MGWKGFFEIFSTPCEKKFGAEGAAEGAEGAEGVEGAETPCMTFCGLQWLLSIFGDKAVARRRKIAESVFARLKARDAFHPFHPFLLVTSSNRGVHQSRVFPAVWRSSSRLLNQCRLGRLSDLFRSPPSAVRERGPLAEALLPVRNRCAIWAREDAGVGH